MSAAYFKLLRSMPVFGGLSDATLELLLDRSTTRKVPAGAYFFCQGDGADSLFVLSSGLAIAERGCDDAVVVYGQFRSGDCIGEMSLLDLMPRSASARAVEECEAIEISIRCLASLYQQSLEQYAIIMMNLGREVSRRLRKADQRLLELELRLRELDAH